MQITQVITFLAVVIAGVVATPAGGPKPPKPSNAPVFYGCHVLSIISSSNSRFNSK
jgi:hypothetical protein